MGIPNYKYSQYEHYSNYPLRKAVDNQSLPKKVVYTSAKFKNQKPKQKVKKKISFLGRCLSLMFVVLMVGCIFPYTYKNMVKPVFVDSLSTSHLKYDYASLVDKTRVYLHNDYFIDKPFLKNKTVKKSLMQPLYETTEIKPLKNELNQLALAYPTIDASIYVWDFNSGKYVNIKANKTYSAASIIKIPVLLELFRAIENKQLALFDKMTLTDYYRAEGSGGLQFQQEGSKYTLNQLARVMIEDSDNSATNMVMSAIGGKPAVNRAIKNWGLKNTYINTWLPDLDGTNYTTSRDIATMLFNIENDSFLTLNSREYIVDYMGHVKNDRLLKAGLPPEASIIHKTGDIGKTLGDAGIIFMPDGRRYIAVILSNRNHNAPEGKDFIVKASSTIYQYFSKNIE